MCETTVLSEPPASHFLCPPLSVCCPPGPHSGFWTQLWSSQPATEPSLSPLSLMHPESGCGMGSIHHYPSLVPHSRRVCDCKYVRALNNVSRKCPARESYRGPTSCGQPHPESGPRCGGLRDRRSDGDSYRDGRPQTSGLLRFLPSSAAVQRPLLPNAFHNQCIPSLTLIQHCVSVALDCLRSQFQPPGTTMSPVLRVLNSRRCPSGAAI